MTKNENDFLVEIITEELPPKHLKIFMQAFAKNLTEKLAEAHLTHGNVHPFATPRRLAVIVEKLISQQPNRSVERKGPALNAAFDANGKPTKACEGFARSCGVSVDQLEKQESPQGTWMVFRQEEKGKPTVELLSAIVKAALEKLPIPRPMRWGSTDTLFIRPTHACVMLYGDHIVPGKILEQTASNVTYGHRFLHPKGIALKTTSDYESALLTQGKVIADFEKRRDEIKKQIESLAKEKQGSAIIPDALLEEVTGLVEWPVALVAKFEDHFLEVPPEALVSAIEIHQRCFPIKDKQGKLLPYFITVSNLPSNDPQQVILGNERVMRARLSDAAFFYHTDCKVRLEEHLTGLQRVIFQAKLGTLYDKSVRLSILTGVIARTLKEDAEHAARAGLLAKTDLLSNMVNEFPELQGIMGHYYALNDGEPASVATAIREQYLPRFSGDALPESLLGCALAIADRIDTLVGIFGIQQAPTGDKDPFGLRRAALGVLRMIIEKELDLDVVELMQKAVEGYGEKNIHPETVPQLRQFMYERLRAWYLEQGILPDVIAAVLAREPTRPLDFHQRVKAVTAFRKLPQAKSLAAAHKRVSNILIKEGQVAPDGKIAENLLKDVEEKTLAKLLTEKAQATAPLYEARRYTEFLTELASLQEPVDQFFDHVMVMVDDEKVRKNRLLLLSTLRNLFLQVADISLLQD